MMRNNKGSVLILGLLIMSILLLFGWIFLSLTLTNYSTLMLSSNELKAYWIAHAGIKKAIYNLRDDYSQYIYDVKKYNFSDGEYEIAIASLDTTGVRNILCVSNGIYQNSSYSMITEIQLDTPTDYLYFFDGNGEFGNKESYVNYYFGGPIHSNSHILFTSFLGKIYVIKSNNIQGPLVSTAGLITRYSNYVPGDYYSEYKVYFGEGLPSYDQNFIYNGTIPDKELTDLTWGFRLYGNPKIGGGYDPAITYPNDFSDSDWAKTPVTPSPVEIFPTSNTPLGLLNDGYHGGYRIHIPTIRKVSSGTKYKATEYADLPIKTDTEWENEIRNIYANYIDDRWFIRGKKLTDFYGNKYYIVENPQGLQIKEFINDSYRTKFVIGKGNGINTQWTIPGHYLSGLEKIGRQDINGSLTEFRYFPSIRRIKNIYFNGLNVNIRSDWTFPVYYQYGANNFVPPGTQFWTLGNSKIAFDTPPTGTNSGNINTKKKNIKIRLDSEQIFRIAKGNGSQTNFEYYPGTISKVYVDSGDGWILKSNPADYTTPLPVDYSGVEPAGVALTTTDNITYEATEKNFAKLFKSEPLAIYRNGSLIHYEEIGIATTDDGTIQSIDHAKGRVTFKNSQLITDTITAKYISRVIIFTTTSIPPLYPYPLTLERYLGNIGIVYSGDITVAEEYGSSQSDGTVPAREFNFEPQTPDCRIKKVTVDTTNAFYVTADYSDGFTWGEIVFLNPPPAITVIGTEWNKGVYLIKGDSPKVNNSDAGYNARNDNPPLYNNLKTSGKYRWYDYTISGTSINIQNKGASSVGYCYNTYPVAPGQEPVPVPPANSLVCLDSPVKSVVIDLSYISPNPKKGVIFSEVPIIVKGKAKGPILIVCLEDVYLQSINSEFSDDSDEASPVGILSAGAVWVDHSGAYEMYENHPESFYDVILNKVAIYTTRGFYYTGGRNLRNRLRLVGSICNLSNDFGSFLKETDMSSWYYTDIIKNGNSYSYLYVGGNAQLYPTSFRGDRTISSSNNHRPPPHMPVYLQIKYFKSSSAEDAQKFIDTVRTYVNDKKKIPKEIYNELIKKL